MKLFPYQQRIIDEMKRRCEKGMTMTIEIPAAAEHVIEAHQALFEDVCIGKEISDVDHLLKLIADKLGDDYNIRDLRNELWRAYDQADRDGTYLIQNPVILITREGGTTHRVIDVNRVVHCIPFGEHIPTVLTWKNKDLMDPINF